jgi:hypothetical protein
LEAAFAAALRAILVSRFFICLALIAARTVLDCLDCFEDIFKAWTAWKLRGSSIEAGALIAHLLISYKAMEIFNFFQQK